jgi:hypothetical protein
LDSKRTCASTVGRAGSVIHVFVSFQRAVSVTWRKAREPGTGDTRARTPGATGSMWRGSSSTTSRSTNVRRR